MNGSAQNYQPSPDLPPPQHEGLISATPETNQKVPLHAELESKKLEMPVAGTPVNKVPSMPFGSTPTVPPPMAATPAAPTATQIPVNSAPPAADDADLIEKEWVNKAKYIVESTSENPHLQNKEMSKFKADYIQKRYNKQLKVSDE